MNQRQEIRSTVAIPAISVLALIGAVLSIISLYHFLSFKYGLQTGPSFCNISAAFNCDAINQSDWAEFLETPLGSYGLFFYLLLFFSSIVVAAKTLVDRGKAMNVILVFSEVSVLVSILLFCVSEFAIGTLCLVCLGMYLVNILLFVTAYLADRSTSLTQRTEAGIGSIISFLKTCCKSGGAAAFARLYLCFLVVLAVAVFALSDSLLVRLMRELNTATVDEELEKRVRTWQTQKEELIRIDSKDFSMGPESAPVQIVEFADFECPACRLFYLDLHDIIQEHPGKIRLTFKNYPLDTACNQALDHQMHQNACFAALLARCAGEQGRYWEAMDILFRSPLLEQHSQEGVLRKEIVESVAKSGLDGAALNDCVTSGRQLDKIVDDIALGNQLKIPGTPSIWINNKRVEQIGEKLLRAIISRILSTRQQKSEK